MTWFLVALGAPLLYTSANFIDKYVLTRFVRAESGVGGVVIFSSLFGAVMIPISYFIAPEAWSLTATTKAILLINGLISVTSLILYLNALQHYAASMVVPLYQLIPVFSYLLGYLVLGEALAILQVFSCALILVGAFALSLSLENGKWELDLKLLKLMSLASFFTALTGVIFKKIATEIGYWQSQFWEYCGIVLLGLLLLLFVESYRRDFINLFRATQGRILGYSSVTEAAMVGGDLLLNFAVLLAPVALVYVVNSFQPLFILVIGLILSKLLPQYYSEIQSLRGLLQKTLSIIIMIVGGVLLAFYG